MCVWMAYFQSGKAVLWISLMGCRLLLLCRCDTFGSIVNRGRTKIFLYGAVLQELLHSKMKK